jgi:hypothetical protein
MFNFSLVKLTDNHHCTSNISFLNLYLLKLTIDHMSYVFMIQVKSSSSCALSIDIGGNVSPSIPIFGFIYHFRD